MKVNTEKIINIAREFSRYPAGRFCDDGDFSGERFRKEWLEPILRERSRAVIELDGARGYGSSFLEEAFGGLVRVGFDAATVKASFEFRSEDPSLAIEILDYIENGHVEETSH